MKIAALWILKLREQYKLPEKTVLSIIGDIEGLFCELMAQLHSQLATSSTDELLDQFSKASESDIFGSLKTSYGQKKYFKDHFNFTVIFSLHISL